MYTEIRRETHHSVNTDDNTTPAILAMRSKATKATRSACRDSNHLPQANTRVPPRQPRPLVALLPHLRLTTRRPRLIMDVGRLVDNSHQHAWRTSRNPCAATEAVPLQVLSQTHQDQGDVTYNLEFKLPSISEHLHLPINPAVLEICSSKEAPAKAPINHDAAAHSKVHQVPPQPKKRRVEWTAESIGTIRVRCSTKFKEGGGPIGSLTSGLLQRRRSSRQAAMIIATQGMEIRPSAAIMEILARPSRAVRALASRGGGR